MTRSFVGDFGRHRSGELADAATALDWLQAYNSNAPSCWISGVSFGAWIAMQLLMRRPEIEGFISVAPPANLYDFTFLAPCPSSGLMVNGAKDRVVPTESVRGLVDRLKTQKGIVIGEKGRLLKWVREQAEKELYEMYGVRFKLKLWVKVEKNWRENFWMLKKFGYA